MLNNNNNNTLVAISHRPIVDFSSTTGEPMRIRVSEIHRKLLDTSKTVRKCHLVRISIDHRDPVSPIKIRKESDDFLLYIVRKLTGR